MRAISWRRPSFRRNGSIQMVLQRSRIALIVGLAFAMVAGMVLGLSTGLLKGPREAQAQAAPPSIFKLCKKWESNGVLSGSRTFTFDVSDISETQQVPIANVTEGGPTVCVFIQASPGPIEVTEAEPLNFDP